MSSNLGFRVINPLASPNLGGTSCASDRVGWPNLSFPRTRRQAGSGSAQSLRARHAHLLFSCPKIDRTAPTCAAARLWGDPGKRPSRWPTPAETQRRELRGEAPAVKGPARFCAALSGRASRESTRYTRPVFIRAHRSLLEFKWNRHILAQTQKIGHSELCKRDFRAGPGSGRSLRPFFTRVLRHVLAQIQRIGQSELQKRDFRAGPGHMKSIHLGTNVKDLQNAENRPSEIFEPELQQQDFRAGPGSGRSLLEFI